MFVSDDNKTYVKTCKNKRVTIHDKKKSKKSRNKSTMYINNNSTQNKPNAVTLKKNIVSCLGFSTYPLMFTAIIEHNRKNNCLCLAFFESTPLPCTKILKNVYFFVSVIYMYLVFVAIKMNNSNAILFSKIQYTQ